MGRLFAALALPLLLVLTACQPGTAESAADDATPSASAPVAGTSEPAAPRRPVCPS